MDKVATLLVAVEVAVDQVQPMQDHLVQVEPVAREVVAQVASSVEQVAPMEPTEPVAVEVVRDLLVAQVAQVAQVWYWYSIPLHDSSGTMKELVHLPSTATPIPKLFTIPQVS
jgi:hypothetical protein